MNNMIVEVKVKHVYGNKMVYPVNGNAKLFADLAKTKTLSVPNICTLKNLGFIIKVVAEIV